MIDIQDMMEMVEVRMKPWFYEHISGFEVKHDNGYWVIRKIRPDGSYGGIWIHFNRDNYETILNNYQVSLYDFQVELYQSCLMETIYHKHMYDNLREVLGPDEVDSAEMDFKAFGEAIAGAISKENKKRSIKLL